MYRREEGAKCRGAEKEAREELAEHLRLSHPARQLAHSARDHDDQRQAEKRDQELMLRERVQIPLPRR